VTEFPVAKAALDPINTNGWISIPQELSKLNHRLYREHKNYYAEVTLNTAVETATPILVYTLAPTWYVLGALRAAKRMHDLAMKEERQAIDQARWYDFRLNKDLPPQFQQLQSYGLAQSMGAFAFHTADEMLTSLVQDINGVNRSFNLVASTSPTNYNVFEEFDAMGNVDDDTPPSAVAGVSPYDDLTEELDTENMLLLQSRGDQPPYNGDTWEAVWVQVGELHSNPSGAQTSTTGFFQAPLGLVALAGDVSAYLTSEGGLTIDRPRVTVNVMPGTYKGVHADAL